LSFFAIARGTDRKNAIPENMLYINKKDFVHTLRTVRSHYSDKKLEKLWQIVAQEGTRVYMDTYLRQITVAMGVRVRTKKKFPRSLLDTSSWALTDGRSQVVEFWKVSWVCLQGLGGPIIMLFTAFHVFCYAGMFAWFGKVTASIEIEVGSEHLYYLNSFNSYLEGMVTLFNLLVVNDWHKIAELYVNPIVGSSACYVYFVVFQLFVSDLLVKIIVGFFVTGFLNEFGGSKRKASERESFNTSFNESFNEEGVEATELDNLLIMQRTGGWESTKKLIGGGEN
jgi:hypothetical protein